MAIRLKGKLKWVRPVVESVSVPSDRRPTVDEIVDALYGVVAQATFKEDTDIVADEESPWGLRVSRSNPRYESDFLTYYADGLRTLGRLGRLNVIMDDGHRYVVAKDPEAPASVNKEESP